MINSLSSVAKEIMVAGLAKHPTHILGEDLVRLAREMYNVPERPENYIDTYEPVEETTAVLVTGGLDSTALYFWAKQHYKNVKAYYVWVNTPYAKKEADALESFGIPVEFLEGPKIDQDKCWQHIIPGRNFLFMSMVAEQIRGGKILFGATNGEMPTHGGDKSLYFLTGVNRIFKKLPYPVVVEVPFFDWTKGEIVRWWLENNSSRDITKTISCFKGVAGACGSCQSCLRKCLAFITNDLTLETDVPITVGCTPFIAKYLRVLNKALKDDDFSHYSKKRCIEDLDAISKLLTCAS